MDDDEDEDEGKAQEKPTPAASKKPAATGWGSPAKDAQQGKANKPSRMDDDDDDDQPKSRRRNLRDMEDEETELVMMIPDLDEEETEDITTQVAAAPRNLARRVQSLQQLNHDIKYTIPSGGGLDLSILTGSLVPAKMVQEEDTVWKFDTLLQEVTQEFNAEAERSLETAKERKALFGDPDAEAASAKAAARPGARKRVSATAE
jgi:hypothetical protein